MAKRWLQLLLGFALPVVATTAFADAFTGSNPSTGKLTWSGFSNGWVAADISGSIFPTVAAGQFQGSFDNDGGPTDPDDFLRFFCIDITHEANGGPNTYTRSFGFPGSFTAGQQSELTRLFDEYYPNKLTGTYYNSGITNFGDFASANDSAAFQLAVWEIVFGDGTSLANPPFTASSTASALAQTWLTHVSGESGTPAGWSFYTFTSGTYNDTHYQNYLSVEYTQPLKELPEPGSLALLCVAAFAVGVAAMRRRQTA